MYQVVGLVWVVDERKERLVFVVFMSKDQDLEVRDATQCDVERIFDSRG